MRSRRAAALAAVAGLSLVTLTRAEGGLPREGDVRFKVTCNFDHSAPDDPIVFPDQPGASHLHDFTGRIGITASTDTYAELVAGRSTCNDREDRAGYWTPAVYAGTQQLAVTRMTAYYRRGSKAGEIEPYPAGLKMVAGQDRKSVV